MEKKRSRKFSLEKIFIPLSFLLTLVILLESITLFVINRHLRDNPVVPYYEDPEKLRIILYQLTPHPTSAKLDGWAFDLN